MRYGLPYKGSKSKLAEWIVDVLPEADTLVDMFAGGCAVTHCAMQSGKWQHFIINDIERDITQLFVDAVNGKYKNENRWISRDTFNLLKKTDPYVRYCWSFGNNGRNYLYGAEIEDYKEAVHRLMYAPDTRRRRLAYRNCVKKLYDHIKRNTQSLQSLERLERLQSLESLERLQSLERLERLERLQRYNLDYQQVPIPGKAVIYCDIPYRGTEKYQEDGFDYDRFYDWAYSQSNIYISEYYMPDDKFEVVAEKEHRSTIGNNDHKTIERLYIPRR